MKLIDKSARGKILRVALAASLMYLVYTAAWATFKKVQDDRVFRQRDQYIQNEPILQRERLGFKCTGCISDEAASWTYYFVRVLIPGSDSDSADWSLPYRGLELENIKEDRSPSEAIMDLLDEVDSPEWEWIGPDNFSTSMVESGEDTFYIKAKRLENGDSLRVAIGAGKFAGAPEEFDVSHGNFSITVTVTYKRGNAWINP